MKRFRHYKKDLAIVLACFGSVKQQKRYLELKKYIESKFEYPVYLSFSSKMVIKKLSSEGEVYKNLPQTLADLDMQGYKRIIVSSINLFPTNEHQLLLDTVKGFREFSLSNIRATKAIFSKTLDSTKILKEIDVKTKESRDVANLYIIHGTPDFDKRDSSIAYTGEFLRTIDKNNYFCSLEGAFPFSAIKESLLESLKSLNKKIQIVPLLLISGNHYEKDVKEIFEFFKDEIDICKAEPLDGSENFNLLGFESIQNLIHKYIKDEITKISY